MIWLIERPLTSSLFIFILIIRWSTFRTFIHSPLFRLRMSAAAAAVQAVEQKTLLLDRDRRESLQIDKLEVSGYKIFLSEKRRAIVCRNVKFNVVMSVIDQRKIWDKFLKWKYYCFCITVSNHVWRSKYFEYYLCNFISQTTRIYFILWIHGLSLA